jgi:hypothetical protein
MFGSVVLDVAIGMVFVFLLLSLIASVLQEMLSAFMQLRPANLLRGLRSLFSGDSLWGADLVDSIYGHGLIRGLFADPEQDLKPRQPKISGSESAVAAQALLPVQPVQPRQNGDGIPLWHVSYPHRLDIVRFWLRGKIGIRPEKDVRTVTNQLLLPAYIPSRTFALSLIDILNRNKATGEEIMNSITQSLAEHHWMYKDNKAGEALYALAVDAKGDIKKFQKHIEDWYNDSMDRASGWYKRYTQRILLFIGFGLAVVFNVSSVRVARTLWFDRDARVAMASAADEYVKQHPNPSVQDKALPANPQSSPDDKSSKAGELERKLQESAEAFNSATSTALLPVGWKHSFGEYKQMIWGNLPAAKWSGPWWHVFGADLGRGSWIGLNYFFGWLITACAVSLGAPFWFDMLNKIMVVRSTVKPQEKSKPEIGKG